jgi:hypothetical protein
LLVAPPLGINRQFLVPLGARSLTVLEPDLFQPRSSREDISIFGDSPFFNDPLLTTGSKPIVQLSSSAKGLSPTAEAVLQRSPAAPALITQHTTDAHPRPSSLSIEAANQSNKPFEPVLSIQSSDNTGEIQASKAEGLSDHLQESPDQAIVSKEIGLHTSSKSPEISSTIETVEDLFPHDSLSFKESENLSTIAAIAVPIPFPANDVQRPTATEAQSDPLSNPRLELTTDSRPDPAIESEVETAYISRSEQIPESKVELTHISRSEQIPESISESASQLTPNVQPQAARIVQPESVDRAGIDSTLKPVSASSTDSTAAFRPTRTVELASNARVEAASDPQSELAVVSTDAISNPIGAIEKQGTVFSQSIASEVTSSQYSQTSEPFSTSTTASSEEPEIITRQAAQENPSIEVAEQLQRSLESTVQRSPDVDLPPLIPSNELAPTPAEKPDSEIDHAAVEPLASQPSTNEITATQQAQLSSTASVRETTFDSGNVTIDAPAPSLLSPTPSYSLQAKGLESSPQSTTDLAATERHSASNAPSTLPLEQPNQFLQENFVAADPEPKTNSQAIFESNPQTLQASLDPQLTSSADVTPLTQTTPARESVTSQVAQVLLQAETTTSIARSLNQPSAEASSIAHQSKHESLFEPLPSSNPPSSIQSDLQLKGTETTPEIASVDHRTTITNANLEVFPELNTGQKAEAFNHVLGSNASDGQAQNLVERSQSSEHTAEASPSKIESLENVQITPEVPIQRTSSTSLESRISVTASPAPDISESRPFDSQSFSSHPNLASHARSTESSQLEAKASQLNLENQTLAIPENKEEAFKASTSVSDKTAKLETSLELLSEQKLNLDQASLTSGIIIGSDFDSNSISDSQSKAGVIQAKELASSESDSLESVVSEKPDSFEINSTSELNKKTFSTEIQPVVNSSSPLKGKTTGKLESPLQLNEQSINVKNLEVQNLESQSPDIQRLAIKSLETRSLQAKGLETQSSERQSQEAQNLGTQGLEAQNLELLSKPEVINQSTSSLTQAQIDTLTTEVTESSDTIARTLEETNQSNSLAENTVDSANTEAHLTHSTPKRTAVNLETASNQNAIQTSISDPVTVNLGMISNQEIAQKQDEPKSPLPSIDSQTLDTLQKAPDTAIAPTSQSFVVQQPEPQQATSEPDNEQFVSVANEGEIFSSYAAPIQRLEDSTVSSTVIADNTTFDTSISGLTEPLPHVQDLPEAQSLPAIQSPVQAASAVVQAQPATQAQLTSEIELSPFDAGSSVAPVNEMLSDAAIAQTFSPAADGTSARSTPVLRSPDSSHPELKASFSLETSPALPLESEQQEHSTNRHDPAQAFLSSPLSSEQGNEPDRPLSSKSTAAHSKHGEVSGAGLLSIKDIPSTDLSTLRLQQAAQTDAIPQAAIAPLPTATPSFAVEAPIQRQVTTSADTASQSLAANSLETQPNRPSASPQITPPTTVAIQPLEVDSLEAQSDESFTSRQITPLADTAIQAFAADPLEQEHSEPLTSPSGTTETDSQDLRKFSKTSPPAPNSGGASTQRPPELGDLGGDCVSPNSLAAQSPQITEPSLTPSAQANLPQSSDQNAPLSNALRENPLLQSRSLQNLEEAIASEMSSQAVVRDIEPVEPAHETVFPAIVQRMPGAGQASALYSSNVVDDEASQPAVPRETKLDNPAGNLSEVSGDTAEPKAPEPLPLVLQPLSTLEPLTASASFFSRASATAPSVQTSRQSTPSFTSTPALEQPQSKSIVKVDRPTTQWSNFSDLVQRQITPSPRSSNRSHDTAKHASAPHSVATVLANTSAMIQRQPDQPETVRISRHDQSPSTAAELSDVVDAKDLEQLAQVIYQQLRQRLRIEQERHGAGRLPW